MSNEQIIHLLRTYNPEMMVAFEAITDLENNLDHELMSEYIRADVETRRTQEQPWILHEFERQEKVFRNIDGDNPIEVPTGKFIKNYTIYLLAKNSDRRGAGRVVLHQCSGARLVEAYAAAMYAIRDEDS